MNLNSEQIQIASLIDARVRELAAAGSDDITTFAKMADYMPRFKRLMDTSTRGEMDALCDRFSGFFRYVKILERVAAGIKSGAIKVPK
jgi:hypothetical protein